MLRFLHKYPSPPPLSLSLSLRLSWSHKDTERSTIQFISLNNFPLPPSFRQPYGSPKRVSRQALSVCVCICLSQGDKIRQARRQAGREEEQSAKHCNRTLSLGYEHHSPWSKYGAMATTLCLLSQFVGHTRIHTIAWPYWMKYIATARVGKEMKLARSYNTSG